jgi:hypothetical protein
MSLKLSFCSIKSFFQKLIGNSFKITSEPSGAQVTYIVDPYDLTQNITCITPCTIRLPWEPQRARYHKSKLLVQKDEYKSKVVPFRLGFKTMSKAISFALALLALYLYKDYPSPMFFAYIIVMMGYSVGSDDIHVVLEKENKIGEES